MREIDQMSMDWPYYGSRRMTAELRGRGHGINRKRVVRLMRLMGCEAVYAKPRTSRSHPEHRKYPYLLRDVPITHADQVWSSDITYLPMKRGFLYLVAVMDWYSRFVLAWQLSNSLDSAFCIEAVEDAFAALTDERWIGRTLDTVAVMPLLDLAAAAQALVAVQALTLDIRGALPSVGGHIEVATITRNEGFKWVSRGPNG